jgi:hypothetical protein
MIAGKWATAFLVLEWSWCGLFDESGALAQWVVQVGFCQPIAVGSAPAGS